MGANLFVNISSQNSAQYNQKDVYKKESQIKDPLIDLLNKQNTALQKAQLALQRSQLKNEKLKSLQKVDSVFGGQLSPTKQSPDLIGTARNKDLKSDEIVDSYDINSGVDDQGRMTQLLSLASDRTKRTDRRQSQHINTRV